jgi:hypothetical protein
MEEEIPRAKKNNTCKTLLWKPELKISLGRPRGKWKDIIKTDSKERKLENTD